VIRGEGPVNQSICFHILHPLSYTYHFSVASPYSQVLPFQAGNEQRLVDRTGIIAGQIQGSKWLSISAGLGLIGRALPGSRSTGKLVVCDLWRKYTLWARILWVDSSIDQRGCCVWTFEDPLSRSLSLCPVDQSPGCSTLPCRILNSGRSPSEP
jgi:hypothetical protein